MEKTNIASTGFTYKLVHRIDWPIFDHPTPLLREGSEKLDKPFIFRMKENVWNSIDEHCKQLGVDKSKWIREAAMRQLGEEQKFFLDKK